MLVLSIFSPISVCFCLIVSTSFGICPFLCIFSFAVCFCLFLYVFFLSFCRSLSVFVFSLCFCQFLFVSVNIVLQMSPTQPGLLVNFYVCNFWHLFVIWYYYLHFLRGYMVSCKLEWLCTKIKERNNCMKMSVYKENLPLPGFKTGR